MTMADLATLTQENADPILLDKHQLPAYAGQKAVLLLFVPFAQTVLEYAKQRFNYASSDSLIPSPVTDFYGELSRLLEMGLTYTLEEWATVFHQTLQKAARHDSLAQLLSIRHSNVCKSQGGIDALHFMLEKFSQGRIHQQELPSARASPENSDDELERLRVKTERLRVETERLRIYNVQLAQLRDTSIHLASRSNALVAQIMTGNEPDIHEIRQHL